MNQSELLGVASWVGITQGTNCVNLHTVLYQRVKQNIVNVVKHVLLFRSLMSKFQKQNKKCYLCASSVSIGKGTVPFCKPTKKQC